MSKVNVKITAERTSGIRATTTKVVAVEEENTERKTLDKAMLLWANQYIAKECGITFNSLTKAKNYAKLKMSAEIYKNDQYNN